ncbi:MAG TPA: SDR family NAD(P)-dependent oxidoreductase [Candidatus Peribacteraceae bacterium]|nr:SDR family NAD(P)-dependent oxidoreductase [Candidatus Peribacteraceae bacterium]
MSLTALITGATAGIGEATAVVLAEHGFRVIINGRRAAKLEELKKKLESDFKAEVLILPFDVRDRASVLEAIRSLPDDWKTIDILVNNAGLALGFGPLQDGNPDDWDTMIDTNIKGLLNVTHAVLPGMIDRKQGHIVNLGSIAGKEVYAGGNVYCMTKHAVDAITKAMRIDLLPHQIRVTSVNPGRVETEFSIVRYRGDAERAHKDYIGYQPLAARDIAEAILFAVTRPPHVDVNDVTVMPTAQANTGNLFKENS